MNHTYNCVFKGQLIGRSSLKTIGWVSGALKTFFCLHVFWVWQSTGMNMWSFNCSVLSFAVTHFPCSESFPSPTDSSGAKKKTLRFMYTSYLSSNRLRGGTWTVIPAENNTSFSSVKPSARAHHGEQALRIHDISLPGNVVHSIFPTTLRRGEIPQRWVKTVKTAW